MSRLRVVVATLLTPIWLPILLLDVVFLVLSTVFGALAGIFDRAGSSFADAMDRVFSGPRNSPRKP